MSGTNGVLEGVSCGANGTAETKWVIIDAPAGETPASYGKLKADNARLEAELKRVKFCAAIDRNDASNLAVELGRVRGELKDVQAECCRLTDVNGDLAKLADAVGAVIAGFNADRRFQRKAFIDADSPNGRAMEAAYRAVKARESAHEGIDGLTEADVIDPSWQPADPPCSRLTEAIKRLEAAFSASSRMTVYDEVVSDVLEAWHEGEAGEEATDDTTATPQPAEAGVNARLLAAAKGVRESWGKQAGRSHYGVNWTGVADSALLGLDEAIEAAQEEGESGEPSINGVNAADIIREQSERIKTLEAVEAAARDFRLAWRSGESLQRFYNALDFALDGLPKGEAKPVLQPYQERMKVWIDEWDHKNNRPKVAGGADAPCNQPSPCGQSCQAVPCQAQSPCPERVHMLAIAARNLIIANRQGRLTQCEINTLDFALDGLI